MTNMIWYRDLFFWRQSIVLFADSSYSIGTGFMLSFPSLLNAAILSPNSTDIRSTQDQASSIGGADGGAVPSVTLINMGVSQGYILGPILFFVSKNGCPDLMTTGSQGLAGVVGFCLLPFIMQHMGRKTVHIGINALVGIGFLIFAFASNIPALYAGRIIQGLSVCGVYVTTIMIAEYSDAKRRGYFITLKKGSVAIGSLISHSMGIYWTWRQVAAFAIIPNIIAIIITLFWKESPSYLAMRGRYDECEKSYKWLHGNGTQQKNDLEDIISAQMERRLKDKTNKRFKTAMLKMLRKDYLIPFVVVCLLTLIIDCCGTYYTLAYIVQILTEITGDKSIAIYCTVGSDFLTVVALVCSGFIINSFKRRQNLFGFGAVSVILMYLISIVSFMKSFYHIEVSAWLTPAIILINVFIVNAGVIPVCFAVIAEIFPLEHKASGLCTTGIVFTLLYAGVLKFTPIMMENTGVAGTFAIYGSLNVISFVILYFILIETKDRTLQEIENNVKGVQKRNNVSYSATQEQPFI